MPKRLKSASSPNLKRSFSPKKLKSSSSPNLRRITRQLSKQQKQLKRSISKTKKEFKTTISPSFGKRAKKACKITEKYNIFTGGICTKWIDGMPNEIANIKYLTDVDLVNKLENACKNDKLKAYCGECKHSFLVHKSNIALFSSKEFERAI